MDLVRSGRKYLPSSIMTSSDEFGALTFRRTLRGAYKHAAALSVIVEDAGTHFARDIVKTILEAEARNIEVDSHSIDPNPRLDEDPEVPIEGPSELNLVPLSQATADFVGGGDDIVANRKHVVRHYSLFLGADTPTLVASGIPVCPSLLAPSPTITDTVAGTISAVVHGVSNLGLPRAASDAHGANGPRGKAKLHGHVLAVVQQVTVDVEHGKLFDPARVTIQEYGSGGY